MTRQNFVDFSPPVINASWLNKVDAFVDTFYLAENYGIVTDGVTDNTDNLQSLIDLVYSRGGGEIYLPVGQTYCAGSLKMKRGVFLSGNEHATSAGQYWETSPEGGIAGASRLHFGPDVVEAGILFDFQLASREARPYGAGLKNILTYHTNQPAGTDGILVRHCPPGQGPFNSGWASGAVRFLNCGIRGAPRYGFRVFSTATEKTNASLYKCRVSESGSHGIYVTNCFDMLIEHCFSFTNGGDGILMEGTATERVIECDIFSNSGNGITLDGFDGRYSNNHIDANDGHGILIKASVSSITNKHYRILGGRISSNGMGADDTYSNIHIEDRSGVLCGNVLMQGISFGTATQINGNTNRLKHEISATALPTQTPNRLVGCQFGTQDLKSGNEPFNTFFQQGTEMVASSDPSGQQYNQHWYPLPAGSGSFWAPNILRGLTHYKTANTSAATLWGLLSSSATRGPAREVYILIDDANTGVDFSSTTLKGNGGVDLAAGASTQGKILHCKCIDGTNWAVQILG